MKTSILGVKIDNLKQSEVIYAVAKNIELDKKFWITTPNPEFIVTAQRDPEFKTILNRVDLAIPDGYGLILASRFLGTRPLILERIAGADVVERLVEEAVGNNWQIGIVGARRGDKKEVSLLLEKLEKKFIGLKIKEIGADAQEKYDIVFACQGMKVQEKWIFDNYQKVKASVFMGVGGSLDYLSGFAKRAPVGIRKLGLEWFWRLLQNPQKHWRRVYRAFIVFPVLILNEKLKLT